MQEKQLPKILYVADVPVELSHAGSTLVYRLLEFYPKDKLVIVQTGTVNRHKIPNVQYDLIENKLFNRMIKTRFSKVARELKLFIAYLIIPSKIDKVVQNFRPDIILTVTYGTTWITATNVSQKYKLPLHLILHDEILLTDNYFLLNNLFKNLFKKSYLAASSRMCISDNMEEYYYSLFNERGVVVYPSRGKQDLIIEPKKHNGSTSLHFCYAGSLDTGDFLPMLNQFSEVIENGNHTLCIFSNLTNEVLVNFPNLLKNHVRIFSMVPPYELKKFMMESVDINILLNSFDFEEVFRYNFSSKVVDYSAVSMPILFWGPASSGVISWGIKMNYPYILSNTNSDELLSIINKISIEKEYNEIAQLVSTCFNEYLSYERNFNTFKKCITT